MWHMIGPSCQLTEDWGNGKYKIDSWVDSLLDNSRCENSAHNKAYFAYRYSLSVAFTFSPVYLVRDILDCAQILESEFMYILALGILAIILKYCCE